MMFERACTLYLTSSGAFSQRRLRPPSLPSSCSTCCRTVTASASDSAIVGSKKSYNP